MMEQALDQYLIALIGFFLLSIGLFALVLIEFPKRKDE